jgi:hypothetical protein
MQWGSEEAQVEFDGVQIQVPPVPINMSVFDWLPKKKLDLLAVIEAFTEMMYAIAKNVARPALTSVKNLEPFLSNLCPENSNLNRRPTTLLATAMFVFSTCAYVRLGKGTNVTWQHTQPIVSNYVLEIMY